MKKTTKVVVAGLITTAALAMYPAQAHADPASDITASEKSLADQIWPTACAYIGEKGVTVNSMTFLINTLYHQGGVTPNDTPLVINYIVYTYCPEYWSSVVAMGNYFRSQRAAQSSGDGIEHHTVV
jgi:hypothetical protein